MAKASKPKIQKHVRRFDLGEMREATKTPQGFLLIPGFATRTGVFPYISGDGSVRRELRHPDDVFDPSSMATLKNAPFTIEHPPEMINPSNVAEYSKGHTTDRVEVNREMIDVDIIVEHQDAIDIIEKEGVRELSSGYIADIVEEEGSYNGAPYNFRQINIRYNHLAGVKKGRAGPEVRMRLDSADAVMRTDEDALLPIRSEFSQESAVADAEESKQQMKRVVFLGKEIDLPSDQADALQDMLDRFDEMRAQVSQLEEQMKRNAKRSDVDINGPKPSPQVKVEQMGPDGKSAGGKTAAGGKVGPGQKTVHPDADDEKEDGDEHEVVGGVTKSGKADDDMEDADEDKHGEDPAGHEDDEEEKEDYEAAPAAGGGGAAMAPVDQLKKDIDGMQSKLDELRAKHDNMAAESMNQGEKKPDRMDAMDKEVQARLRTIRKAEKILPLEKCERLDSMTVSQIHREVIAHVHPRSELKGETKSYLRARFDSIVATHEETSGAEERRSVGRGFMGGERNDATEKVDPENARRSMVKRSSELWKENLSGHKKQ